MADQNNQHPATGFWFGFAIGALIAGGGAVLIGTKKGRQTVRDLLEFGENFEENTLSLLKNVQEKAQEVVPMIAEEFSNTPASPHGGIGGLLNRIKVLAPTHDKDKKKYLKSTP